MKETTIFLLLTLLTTFSYAQEIKKHYDENKMVSKVEFYSNGELKNTISLENPFNITSYDSIDEGKGAIVYHISEDDLSKLGNVFFQELSLDSKIIEVSEIGQITYQSRVFQMRDGYYMVIHTLNAVDQYNKYCATSATGKLYDSEGNFMIEIKPSNKGIYSPLVMNSGDFLIFNTNNVNLSAQANQSLRVSFDVYNIEHNKLIYSHNPKNSIRFFPPMTDFDYFIVVTMLEKDSFELLVLKPESRKIYLKNITQSELYSIVRYEEDGVVFKTEDGGERKDVFEDDFTQKLLQQKKN